LDLNNLYKNTIAFALLTLDVILQTINSLLALKSVTPEHLLDEPHSYSPTDRRIDTLDRSPAEILDRGQAFWDKIYNKISRRVMSRMDRSGTEDLGLVARLMYGHVLSNTAVLSPAETPFVLIAGLIPQDVRVLFSITTT
jgi:hypothetical protein